MAAIFRHHVGNSTNCLLLWHHFRKQTGSVWFE